MALDEAAASLLQQMTSNGEPLLQEMTPVEARAFARKMRLRVAAPAVAGVRDIRIRVSGGFVSVRILTPIGRPHGVIVYYHGGGWVLGGLDDSDLTGRQLAQATQCIVILADYRLAPEYRFPTAVDDSWATLTWAAGHVAELAGRTLPLIVAGESAGGNLAAVMTLRAMETGGPSIAAQVLAYPVTDCDLDSTSYVDPANELMLTRDCMIWFWNHYAPDLRARAHPYASPLRATNFRQLPPAIILTAEHDVLRDEGELYATRLVQAGVPVFHRRFVGQMHGFFTKVGLLPAANDAMAYVAANVSPLLAPSQKHDRDALKGTSTNNTLAAS